MNRLTLPCLCLIACGLWPGSSPQAAGAEGRTTLDRRTVMLDAMKQELGRSMQGLRMDDFEPPYFMAFEMKQLESTHIQARYGAVVQSNSSRSRRLRVEVRIGSYAFDSIGSKSSDFDFSFEIGFHAPQYGPIDDEPLALRNSLWLLADQNYKAALKSYLKLKSKKVTEVDQGDDAGSFSREQATRHTDPPASFTFDQAGFERLARTLSARFEGHPEVFDSHVSIEGGHETRWLVTSEGTRLITEKTIYNLSAQGSTRADDGMLLSNQLSLYAPDVQHLPAPAESIARVDRLISELEALRRAPVLEPYTGPAILDGEATAVLFHEVVGHRLEGERQLDDHEGRTFKGQVGKPIIPTFLSLVDDPTLEKLSATPLNGFYRFDDEGVGAQRVVLVDHGVLKSFLTSRTPLKDTPRSNGHGRSASGEKPRARMASTMLLSERTMPFERLKAMMLEEVSRQSKPYGLIVKNIIGGSTQTTTFSYQAYKGMPQLVYRVFPDGREELVRGVEIVGTPLTSINKIVATSDKPAVFNGYCGAESGYVPVSAVAPDVLITEIELQRTMKKSAKPPLLPSPWNGEPTRTPAVPAPAKTGEKPAVPAT